MLPIRLKTQGRKLNIGFSLIEMIIVVSILGLVAVIASGFLLVSLTAGNKTEATKEVRQNGNYALSVMEGMIVSSRSVGCTSPGPNISGIKVIDIDGNWATFLCDENEGMKKISSSSAALAVPVDLTGANVTVFGCQFVCEQDPGRPIKVRIVFTVQKGGSSARASEKASLKFQTEVMGKNF